MSLPPLLPPLLLCSLLLFHSFSSLSLFSYFILPPCPLPSKPSESTTSTTTSASASIVHPPSDKTNETNETNETKEKDEGQEKDRCQAYLEKLYPLLAGAVDISTYEDECCSPLGVSYNTLSSIMTNHDIIKEILVCIVHNVQACGAGDVSALSDDVQVAVSFYVRDCPSPEHARECVSFFSPLSSLPPFILSSISLPHHSHQKYTEI